MKILVIEDNKADQRLVREMFRDLNMPAFELAFRDNLTEGIAELGKGETGLIILDLGLPESQGIETFLRIKPHAEQIPIVVLTGLDDREVALTSVKKGAQDYLVKSQITSEVLKKSLLYAIERQRLIEEMHQYAREIQRKEAGFRTLIEKNADAMIVLDKNGLVQFLNPAAEMLFERTSADLIGSAFSFQIEPGRIIEKILDFSPKRQRTVEIRVVEIEWERLPAYLVTMHDITERKEAEERLKHFNEELELAVKERTGQLNKSLHEKEILLKEIHHRVKNNLQIIISLLRLQKRQISDTATHQHILDSESRIRSMALVHENLYRSSDLASINFDNYIKTLVNQLISMYAINPGQVRIVIDMKGISIDINQAIPLGLIMNELISNTMKYAFPEGRKGELSISGIQQGGFNVFTVRDNGVGIPPDFDWRETKTLGMHLVIMLTEQIKGTIELEKGAGTLFRLTLPEKT